MRIIDITRELTAAPVYPGDTVPSLRRLKSIEDGEEYNYSQITMGAHSGTHADAPLHFISGTPDALALPPSVLIGECTVIEVPEGLITGDYVERHFPRKRERLLLKSGGGGSELSPDAAELIADSGIRLIGTEALSIGAEGGERKTHIALLRRGVVILESLCMDGVKPGKYFLVAAPLKIAGAEAAPARVFLLGDYIFWTGTVL
ncbi:MAG: cyclase family protein [Clostridium sp.]|jgi:arylformamidase|nr:cyclase family protein [Clostridium sp.]